MRTLTAPTKPTPKIQPLSKQLPHTFEGVVREREEALSKYFLLQEVCHKMETSSEPLFEAVVPANTELEIPTARSFGTNAINCIEDVHRKRLSNPHLFLNLEGDISVVVSPEDINTPHHLSSKTEDRTSRHRVVWSKEERSSTLLI